MASYTLTELNNRSGEVVEAAYDGPVDITSRGRRKFVILTAAQFDRLSGRTSQRAHHVADMPDDERQDFLSAMDGVASEADQPDG